MPTKQREGSNEKGGKIGIIGILSQGITTQLFVEFYLQLQSFNNRRGERGIFPYVFLALSAFIKYKPPVLTAFFNGKKMDFSPLVFSILNGREYGGGAKIAPDAYIDDGLLNIIAVKKASFFKIMKSVPDLFNGRIMRHSDIVSDYTSRAIEIKCKPQTVFHLDGEDFISDGILKFSILPRLLNVKTPKLFKET